MGPAIKVEASMVMATIVVERDAGSTVSSRWINSTNINQDSFYIVVDPDDFF